MRFRKLKHGATVNLTGVEQVSLWLMWVRGESYKKREFKKYEPYRNTLLRPKHKEDEEREEALRTFQKKHHIKFFYKRGADIGEFNFRFTKGFSLPLPPKPKVMGIRGAKL